jgi:hypothetical protein
MPQGFKLVRHLEFAMRNLAMVSVLLSGALCQADELDLSTIERHLNREPAFALTPRYCLLVFGADARDRVWLVEDGDKFYVDGNGNGDITEAAEEFGPAETDEFDTIEGGKVAKYVTQKYDFGQLHLPGSEHTEFTLTRVRIGSKPAIHILSVNVGGLLPQYAGWRPMFAPSPEDASVVHFGASVIPQSLRYHSLSITETSQELHLRIGTPGIGANSFASVSEEALPDSVHPIAEIAWPTGGEGESVRTTVTLLHRC